MDIPLKNTGVLLKQRPSDFVAGALPYEIRVPNGDWRPFLIAPENQFDTDGGYTDTMGCVSFSALSSLEVQARQQLGQEINFSDRFLAKMSDTQKYGNYQYKVADAIRHYGLVLENEYPAPDDYDWNSYYAPIPQEIINKAKRYDTGYEWVGTTKTDLEYHLKHAPLQIVITRDNPIHAVLLVAIEQSTAFYFDTYPGTGSYLKTLPISSIYNALKLVINYEQDMKFPAIKKQGEPTIYAQCGNTLFPFASGEAYIHAGGIFGREKELSESEFYKFDVQAESIIINT